MHNFRNALLLLSVAAWSATAQDASKWDSASHHVVRLDPTVFESLPFPIRELLLGRGCSIPQTPGREEPHNVIVGNLDDFAAQDWVVLCSIEERSALLVFWNESANNVAEITAWSDDKQWLQTGLESIEFGRIVEIVDAHKIVSYSQSYDKNLQINPTHDGVDEGFDGKASVVHYWDGATWLQLQGAD